MPAAVRLKQNDVRKSDEIPANTGGRHSRPLSPTGSRIAKLAILLGVFMLFLAPATNAAKSCKTSQISAAGTATSQSTAKRNALISLMAKLDRRFPGDAKVHMKGPIRHDCEHPFLWRCKARVNICR